jgi:fatty acid desaturase
MRSEQAGAQGQLVTDSDTELFRRLDRKELVPLARALSKVNNVASLWALACQWMVIAGCFAFVHYVDRWWAWPIAAVIIATRQHALFVLMHEASHYHLLSNRFWNEVVSDLFCAFPIIQTTEGFRRDHITHHRFTNTSKDPYWVSSRGHHSWHFPKSPLRAIGVFLGDCVGLFSAHLMKGFLPWTYPFRVMGKGLPAVSRAEHVRFFIYLAVLITLLVVTGGWLQWLVLWVYPSSTLMAAMFRLRGLGEHPLDAESKQDELRETRDIVAPWPESALLAPLNAGYHLTHHIFPSIPFNNLPAMHKELAKLGLFEKGVNYFDTYCGRGGLMSYLTREEPASAVQESAPASQPGV